MIISVNAFAAYNEEIDTVINGTAKYIYETTKNPTVSSIGGEWAVLGLARSGYGVYDDYYDKYYKNVIEYVKEHNAVLHDKKYTEYSRVIIALTAIGKNPSDVSGYNLIMPLGDYDKTIWQGLNGPVWALIALDCGNYEIPYNKDAQTHATRDMYIDKILKCQLPDGGWPLTAGGVSDPDITGMALQALSRYKIRSEVLNAIEKGLIYLSDVQDENGGFSSRGVENAESCAQVLTALCELGISPNDERFVKNGKTVADSLLTYYADDGGFRHTKDSASSNQMATEQCLYALTALKRYSDSKNSLYDMGDVTITNDKINNGSLVLNEYVKKMPVVYPERTFSDIANHKDRIKIEALYSRNIINGKNEDVFDPDSTMTRAEFAAIVVKSLGLEIIDDKAFDDVFKTDWFYGFVSTAYKHGIVSGVSEKMFNPNGLITKEEAAVMVSRAASICGIDTAYNSFASRDILAGFTDYKEASSWSYEALAFCYDKGIYSDEDIEIGPKKNVTRADVAVMLYNLLSLAGLL